MYTPLARAQTRRQRSNQQEAQEDRQISTNKSRLSESRYEIPGGMYRQ